ncbi:MAG TPA: hypothetical protein VGF55_27295, partial [Gemmataceae bacterium]
GAGPELLGLFELPYALGLRWADLKAVAGGPMASISLPVSGHDVGTVVVIDVTGRAPAVPLRSAAERAKQAGAAVRDVLMAGEKVTVWNLPDGARRRPIGVFTKDDLLLIADPPDVLGPVLAAWGDPKQSLAETAAYRAIRGRTAMKPAETADLMWFFDPFGWDTATRTPPTGKKKRVKDTMEVMKQEGFDGVRAIGGSAAFASGECDALVRVAVYAPPPHRGALNMLSFRPATDLKPAAGLPGDLAACLVGRIDLMTAFESFGGIFDEIAADGEKGTYKELIDDLRDNPKGPRVDLRKEIVAQVGDVVTVLTDCQQPLTPTSDRAVAVFTVKDEAVVAAAVRRAVEDDPKVRRTTVAGRTVWEIVPDPPVAKPGEPPPAPLPNAALCVADGKFYVATQAALVEKLFRAGGPRLDDQPDYQRVCRQFDRLGGGSACARLFARPAEDFRLTYDQWRNGKLDEATSIYGIGLAALVPKNPAANTVWTLDGRKLPAYDRVSRLVGPAGVLLFVRDDGWDGVGFVLPR